MNPTLAYLAGLITFAPTLIVQVLIARDLTRAWPHLRRLFYALAAIPLLVWLLGFPGFNIRFPGSLLFALGFWLYACVPAYVGYKLVEWIGLAAWRKPVASSTSPHDSSRRDLIRTAALATAAAPCAVLLYGTFIERTNFGVTESTIPIANLPRDLVGLRILQLSDVHRSAFLSQKLLARVVDAARELKADLIIHTGDFISSKGDPIDDCLKELARLHGSAEAFGCLGNHEIYAGVETYATQQAARLGLHILRSRAMTVQRGSARLNIAGVDYQRMGDRPHYLKSAQLLVDPNAVNILLSHNPDVFPVAARMGFELTMSGHTHGGQVRTEILHQDVDLARFYTPYIGGLYETGGRHCYVTRGIGTIGVPSRIGAPPEISLLRLSQA